MLSYNWQHNRCAELQCFHDWASLNSRNCSIVILWKYHHTYGLWPKKWCAWLYIGEEDKIRNAVRILHPTACRWGYKYHRGEKTISCNRLHFYLHIAYYSLHECTKMLMISCASFTCGQLPQNINEMDGFIANCSFHILFAIQISFLVIISFKLKE